VKKGGNIDDVPAAIGLHGMVEHSSAHIERTQSVDLYHGLEPISAKFLCTGKEVTSSAIDKNVNLTEALNDSLYCVFARLVLADITWNRETRCCGESIQLCGNSLELFSLAAHEDDCGTTVEQEHLGNLLDHASV